MTKVTETRQRTWSWSLGRIRGIDVRVHATFLLLVAWFGANPLLAGEGLAAAGAAMAFVLLVFGCVVLHELGHSLVALRFGIGVRNITLYPIGGVARLERMPEDPRQEFLVAIAGPLVNVVLAALILAVLYLTGSWVQLEHVDIMKGPLFQRLALVNLTLALFNLLPAFPMDGGRVLRALLTRRLGRVQATNVAAALGRTAAVVFGLVGLTGSPVLALIAVFIWLAGSQEAAMVQARAATKGLPVSAAMETRFVILRPQDSLADAERELLAGAQVDFPVVDARGRVCGVLRRDDLMQAVAEGGRSKRVAHTMHEGVVTVDAQEDLSLVFDRVGESNQSMFPVLRGGRLVGLLTLENLGEFLTLHKAHETGRQG